MEIKDLIGGHLLSGFDTAIEKSDNYYNDNCEVVRFVLDDVTYKAIEDPSDGYRSYLKELIISDDKITNNFLPQKVIGKMKENGDYSKNDTIQFFDAITNKVVLEIGTDNTDDYYPYCVMNWSPQNFYVNL